MSTPSAANQATSRSTSDHRRGLLAAGVVVLCWSGFNIVSRLGSKGAFTPYDLAAMRFAVSGLLAMPCFLLWVPRRDWPRCLALALCGGLGYSLLVYSGFAYAPAAHAGVFVNGGIPLWTVVLVAAMNGFRLPRPTLIALLLSCGGLVIIGWESLFSARSGAAWIGDILFFLAAGFWAVFGLLLRRWRLPPHHAILGVAVFSLVLYLPIYGLWLPKTIAAAPLAAVGLQCLYQGVIAALLAGGMYSYANQKIGACQASMMLALVPGVSALGAYLLLDEALPGPVLGGIVIVSLGALLGALPSGEPEKQKAGRKTASGPTLTPPAASGDRR